MTEVWSGWADFPRSLFCATKFWTTRPPGAWYPMSSEEQRARCLKTIGSVFSPGLQGYDPIFLASNVQALPGRIGIGAYFDGRSTFSTLTSARDCLSSTSCGTPAAPDRSPRMPSKRCQSSKALQGTKSQVTSAQHSAPPRAIKRRHTRRLTIQPCPFPDGYSQTCTTFLKGQPRRQRVNERQVRQ